MILQHYSAKECDACSGLERSSIPLVILWTALTERDNNSGHRQIGYMSAQAVMPHFPTIRHQRTIAETRAVPPDGLSFA